MPYIVVKREQSVLSRVEPNALLTWEPFQGSGSPPPGAITFETFSGADKCARMQGGEALLAGTDDSRVAAVDWRKYPHWSLGDCGADNVAVEVET